MKTKLRSFLFLLAVIAGVHPAAGQSGKFFRICGPTSTVIMAFNPAGTLVWTNALAGTNYTVQTASFLPAGTNWVDYVQLAVTNNVSTNLIVAFNPPAGMIFIPAGTFTMGDVLDGESDASPTNVFVSAFYLDANLVDYGEWQAIYSWAIKNGFRFDDAGDGQATNHPVQMLNWWDAIKWCNARSLRTGLTPVYYTDAGLTQIYTNGEVAPFVNWTNSGFRLPTEAEWEKAARGGASGRRFPWGNIISASSANYYGNIGSYDLGPNGYNVAFTNGGFPYTSPVGYFPANNYGLYDMAGNVFEWCWDWYGTPYAGGADPRGAASGIYRVLRGGSWNGYPGNARCSGRAGDYPNAANGFYGFRCVRGL